MLGQPFCDRCATKVSPTEIFHHIENFHVGGRSAGSLYDIFCGECNFRSCEQTCNRMIDHMFRTKHKTSKITMKWTMILEKEAERIRDIIDEGVQLLGMNASSSQENETPNSETSVKKISASLIAPTEKLTDEESPPKLNSPMQKTVVGSCRIDIKPKLEVTEVKLIDSSKETLSECEKTDSKQTRNYSNAQNASSQEKKYRQNTEARKPKKRLLTISSVTERRPTPGANVSRIEPSISLPPKKEQRKRNSEKQRKKTGIADESIITNSEFLAPNETNGKKKSRSSTPISDNVITNDEPIEQSSTLSELDQTLELQYPANNNRDAGRRSSAGKNHSNNVTLNKILDMVTDEPETNSNYLGKVKSPANISSLFLGSEMEPSDETMIINTSKIDPDNYEQCLQCGELVWLMKPLTRTQRYMLHHVARKHSDFNLIKCSACSAEFQMSRRFWVHRKDKNCQGEKVSIRTAEKTEALRLQLKKCFPDYDFEHALTFSYELGDTKKYQIQKPRVVAAPREKAPRQGDCHLCPRDGLTTTYSMIMHARCHTDLRLFECSNCKNRYKHTSSMKWHKNAASDPACDGSYVTVETPEDRAKIRATLSDAFPEFDWNQKFPPGRKYQKMEL